MEKIDLNKEDFSNLLKKFLQIEIKKKYEKAKDFVDSLEGEVASSTVYGFFDRKTSINITLFSLFKICRVLDISPVEFIYRFTFFITEKRFIDEKKELENLIILTNKENDLE